MKIINTEGHLSEEALRDYLKGELSEYNHNRVERHLLSCQFDYERLEILKQSLNELEGHSAQSLKKSA